MTLKKNDILPLNTEEGQIGWATCIWFLLFLCIVLCACLQVQVYISAALYMEDALAASNLAAAVIDVERYGISHEIVIDDPQSAYLRYQKSIEGNLELDDDWTGSRKSWLLGGVTVDCFTVYNVFEDEITFASLTSDGAWHCGTGVPDSVYAPNGEKVEATGIYSELAFDVEGLFGMVSRAHKGKLVDIVMNE